MPLARWSSVADVSQAREALENARTLLLAVKLAGPDVAFEARMLRKALGELARARRVASRRLAYVTRRKL